MANNVRVVTENLPEQRCLEALLCKEIELGLVTVDSALTASGALGVVQLSLLDHPERPVALVVNAGDDPEEIEEMRGAAERMLSGITSDGWLVALAIPDVDAWVMADPRIKQAFEADEAARQSRYERAERIGDLARVEPIARHEIARAFPDFRALLEFIARHAPVAQPTT